jgi:hypothetical protein
MCETAATHWFETGPYHRFQQQPHHPFYFVDLSPHSVVAFSFILVALGVLDPSELG